MFMEMDNLRSRTYMDRLVSRRDRILARLDKLEAQRKQLDHIGQWQDAAGQQLRRNLLHYLTNFHLREVDQLNSALHRMATGEYGMCLACNGQIEADWLESFPEAEFCSTCHTVRERMRG